MFVNLLSHLNSKVHTMVHCSAQTQEASICFLLVAPNVVGAWEEGATDEPLRGEEEALATNRTYRDEVSAESLRAAGPILRVWLPPALLDKLGVPQDEA